MGKWMYPQPGGRITCDGFENQDQEDAVTRRIL
jgi:hypothetical protein